MSQRFATQSSPLASTSCTAFSYEWRINSTPQVPCRKEKSLFCRSVFECLVRRANRPLSFIAGERTAQEKCGRRFVEMHRSEEGIQKREDGGSLKKAYRHLPVPAC